MLRNLYRVNRLPPRPTRCERYMTGARRSPILTASMARREMGRVSTSTTLARTMSRPRLITMWDGRGPELLNVEQWLPGEGQRAEALVADAGQAARQLHMDVGAEQRPHRPVEVGAVKGARCHDDPVDAVHRVGKIIDGAEQGNAGDRRDGCSRATDDSGDHAGRPRDGSESARTAPGPRRCPPRGPRSG